jgi:hypothetical protein
MELVVSVLKYTFVVGAGVEALLMLRALYQLARDKAKAADLPAAPAEE